VDACLPLFYYYSFSKLKHDLFLPGNMGILQEDQSLLLSHANIATPRETFVLFLVTK
jgi:hypothetical protein